MQILNFDDELARIIARDARYPHEAYLFVKESLNHTQKRLGKPSREEIRHVTGQQLLEGIREYAVEHYGPMSITVLEEWNIRTCEDFGEVVFNMVEANLLAKTKSDTREDFRGGYSFEDAFCKPFLPQSRQVPAPSTALPRP